jgi:hypothetical protein
MKILRIDVKRILWFNLGPYVVNSKNVVVEVLVFLFLIRSYMIGVNWLTFLIFYFKE